ncbi:predicted protein [Coccidioides posadasii str. Silveira]|uniref:Predicted protein n=2 Tax=Coccidioides posadasii TaxID=199306 RepID=E9D8Z2_COCPS|nr:predicted protein [Coccidioides posadasii str. Silveira]KMM69941.1 hypothetical protein CPAG_06253 [Coccidioides posadasii RMSCC 3488]
MSRISRLRIWRPGPFEEAKKIDPPGLRVWKNNQHFVALSCGPEFAVTTKITPKHPSFPPLRTETRPHRLFSTSEKAPGSLRDFSCPPSLWLLHPRPGEWNGFIGSYGEKYSPALNPKQESDKIDLGSWEANPVENSKRSGVEWRIRD